MRNRDVQNYNQGTQNKEKLLVIQFLGWQIIPEKRARIEYIPAQIRKSIDHHHLRDGTELILWYELLGQNKPVYNKFPMSPSKRRKETEGKLITQLCEYAHIDELEVGQYYAIWQLNVDKSTHGTDKPGYWYWTDYVKLKSQRAASDVFRFKSSLAFKDIDYPHPKNLILYVSQLGHVDGPALYAYTTRKFDTDDIHDYQFILGLFDYVTETEVLSPRVVKFLKLLKEKGLLEKYLNER